MVCTHILLRKAFLHTQFTNYNFQTQLSTLPTCFRQSPIITNRQHKARGYEVLSLLILLLFIPTVNACVNKFYLL